ncbi:Lrp/AsnC family transcriptional regulator [Streptomyces sp. NPDC059176]|uniref:Lrp/AsnC family transcriptional regulator n=1 Tax=Streptomyces sp. NPDC059176 TaxID=3346758 RepID=UPI0036BBDE22
MAPVDNLDNTDRVLLTLLQQDAGKAYAVLGKAIGLSAGAAHERVRKLRERGVIRRTRVDVDPAALGLGVLAFVMVESSAWMGDSADAFAAIPEIEEAHVIAGSASILVKVRTATTEQLQDVLRRLYAIDGVCGTQATVALETFFERPPAP